jgi:hypothetical protein
MMVERNHLLIKENNMNTIMKMLPALLLCFALPLVAQHGGGRPAGAGMQHMGGSSMDHGPQNDHAMGAGKSEAGTAGTKSGRATVSEQLADNTKLNSKLQSLLPPGTDMSTASAGFKNLGQFVAAVHVSKNLGIPFADLKSKMVGPPEESLGKAIHALKPDADSKTEASKALAEAKDDMRETKETKS